jgi:hypothetical protein
MSQDADCPAFPVPSAAIAMGVSRRDWFAAMALQGIVIKGLEVMSDRVVTIFERDLIMAQRAYALADAMVMASDPEPEAEEMDESHADLDSAE